MLYSDLPSLLCVVLFLPSLMKKMPKSGGWLNVVKVVFAFILHQLEIPCSRMQVRLGIVTRVFVIALWIVISVMLGFFLGRSKLPTIRIPIP